MAKAGLPEVRKTDLEPWRVRFGGVVRIVRGTLSLKEFADAIDRDERQIARWESGEDRPQFDAIFAVDRFQAPLIAAMAGLSECVEVETVVRIRRAG
jgi:hypothetical protein